MNKAQIIAAVLAVIFIAALVVLGIMYMNNTNERLRELQDRASGVGWDRQRPTPAPTDPEPTPEPAQQPPRTGDLAPVNPDSFVTRAMMTAMLAKLDEADLSGYTKSRFDDVPEDEWYSPAVAWAADMGLVSGIGGGKFDPETYISREQMAVMLNNYLKFKGRVVTVGETPGILDLAEIGGWALESVNAVRYTGILPDRQNKRFMPQGKITNAETDAIFARLVAFLGEEPVVYPGGNDLDDYGDWLPEYQPPESSPLPLYRDETLKIPNN